ncbi:AraC family transcriptional regulator [Hymenobacter sp. YC55]|uniref:helix-turn-helix domain-containing protein n=1 Tax=Hymenobacter sp. YC55 TaxID=3034019 RepID=UPI0023F8E481|nr:AraC family transcriptional regulator [Hymenobacter sp. YC55]MDF7813764.1 helix-turn-helix transcriptional regulator [Hymenobacter sp. YC55]
MKKEERPYHKFNSLSEAHRAFGLPKPQHPLISLIDNTSNQIDLNTLPNSIILNFYKISYKIKLTGSVKYGQGSYDFDEGGLLFAAPEQVIGIADEADGHRGYSLFISPEFLLHHPLAKKIKQYGFFSYSVNEALHLSDQEKSTIDAIFKLIEEELNSRIDDFSQEVLISQIELLLNCCNRFYKRQFITRKAVNNDLLQALEDILEECFSANGPLTQGLPTVHFLAEKLNISSSYLSDMLRSLTGQNAQQHIHNKLIEKAKVKISTTNLTISEIAYELGFEHPSSFTKLFKAKTTISPLEFRQSFV